MMWICCSSAAGMRMSQGKVSDSEGLSEVMASGNPLIILDTTSTLPRPTPRRCRLNCPIQKMQQTSIHPKSTRCP
jgi:hypothetical protein